MLNSQVRGRGISNQPRGGSIRFIMMKMVVKTMTIMMKTTTMTTTAR